MQRHPSIFQLIVLPYLSARPVTSSRTISSRGVFCTTALTRKPEVAVEVGQGAETSYLPLRCRDTGVTWRSKGKEVERAGTKELSNTVTTVMAIDRLSRIFQPIPEPDRPSDPPSTNLATTAQAGPSHHTLTRTTDHPPDRIHRFPPSIYHLLQQRLYRLAVFHIIRTPEYALDAQLLSDVSAHLDRHGAGKLSGRLKKGFRIKRVPVDHTVDRQEVKAGRMPDGSWVEPVRSESSTPKARIRLWSEPDKERIRKPPDHWRHLSTVSTTSSFPSFLDQGGKPDTTEWKIPRKGKRHKEQRQTQLTAYYNAHLSDLISRPDPISPLPAPAPTLAQLRQLLHRINKLEEHRGFIPDRITGNIIIKCWLCCGSAFRPRLKYRRMVLENGDWVERSKARTDRVFAEKEVRALWVLVKRLMSSSPPSPAPISDHSPVTEDTKSPTTNLNSRPNPSVVEIPSSIRSASAVLRKIVIPNYAKSAGHKKVRYEKHIRPFCHSMIRAFREMDDREGMREVLAWQAEQREKTG